jgi:hypothetical protein
VVCGSAASWMINNVLRSRGGLHNRVTAKMRLLPFSLAETEAYFFWRGIKFDRKQMLELYMCLGGVPHYLRQVRRGLSVAQNIDEICFAKDGFLRNEFEILYSSLFGDSSKHEAIVTALARKRQGMTRSEILVATKLGSSGGVSSILAALEESGFIVKTPPINRVSNDAVYRLVDEYSLFYLRWIRKAPGGAHGMNPSGYWATKKSGRAFISWSGFSFESVCLKHIEQIKKALGIGGIATTETGWREQGQGELAGVQVDLLINRADNCLNICEMKFSADKFAINKSYAGDLWRKIHAIQAATKSSKTVFLTLVTTYGVTKNAYSLELVDSQVTMDALFE